jgi:hypothetical protein
VEGPFMIKWVEYLNFEANKKTKNEVVWLRMIWLEEPSLEFCIGMKGTWSK